MPLTAAEQRVCEAVEAGRDELVGLAGALIGFDTTARQVGDPCRDEAALQELGLPAEVAEKATRVMYGFGLLDIVQVAQQCELEL